MRTWKCRGCGDTHPRVRQKCPCGRKRPAARKPAHAAALDLPYEVFLAVNGGVERCGICGAAPKDGRRLDRDHCHASGQPRGLLCHLCNRTLGNRITVEWLEAAIAYLRRSRLKEAA